MRSMLIATILSITFFCSHGMEKEAESKKQSPDSLVKAGKITVTYWETEKSFISKVIDLPVSPYPVPFVKECIKCAIPEVKAQQFNLYLADHYNPLPYHESIKAGARLRVGRKATCLKSKL